MATYRVSSIAGLAHLGHARYDRELEAYENPTRTLCGIESSNWSTTEPRIDRWASRRIGSICLSCDRTALWETLRVALAK